MLYVWIKMQQKYLNIYIVRQSLKQTTLFKQEKYGGNMYFIEMLFNPRWHKIAK